MGEVLAVLRACVGRVVVLAEPPRVSADSGEAALDVLHHVVLDGLGGLSASKSSFSVRTKSLAKE